jgi:23S rRNA pseudouridine1911/1915/1917 synthase
MPGEGGSVDSREHVVSADDSASRLDAIVARAFPDLSRSFVQRLVDLGQVTLDGNVAKASAKPRAGQLIALVVPAPAPSELVPRDLPLVVVYEDADVLVVDKPAGLVVHPAPGHPDDTLANALRHRYPDLAIGGELRPGIVHRLDKDTSGLLVIAKNDRAMADLVGQMKARTMLKEYVALVPGDPSPRSAHDGRAGAHATRPADDLSWSVIDAPIARHPRDRLRMAVVAGGREARTRFAVAASLGRYSLVRARLETGRTHQIRVHFASIGHPIVGDATYAPGRETLGLDRQFLHAVRLGFRRPEDGREAVFESPLPADLQEVLDGLQSRE